ncbi:hypothetical protein PCANC_05796 [Puccinia coronata f. sp. avenae]|uniref:CBM1 domain-containing protein n=1 Tax=Puccinia coronata f. sp. avenae TaxID=200324 RepID=A0A2N5V5F1_9BASI|nr:hypothetical protein PCASD_04021 [Puccinia coronata f. sp. avenae]PLW53076.1 hypothetical protein PCANC_05796 [Puccinia coronata f. sp. avenae]
MHFIYFLTACILTSAAGVASADSPAPRQCSFYTGANTNSATCNEIPNLTCMQGCGWNFVVAEGCQPTDGTWAPPSTQVCDVGFGRDTAAAKGAQLRAIPGATAVSPTRSPTTPAPLIIIHRNGLARVLSLSRRPRPEVLESKDEMMC